MILKHNILCKKSYQILIILMMTLHLKGYSIELIKPWGFFAHKKNKYLGHLYFAT